MNKLITIFLFSFESRDRANYIFIQKNVLLLKFFFEKLYTNNNIIIGIRRNLKF